MAQLGPWLLPGSGQKVWGARPREVSWPWDGLAWVGGGALTYHVSVHVFKRIPRECCEHVKSNVSVQEHVQVCVCLPSVCLSNVCERVHMSV